MLARKLESDLAAHNLKMARDRAQENTKYILKNKDAILKELELESTDQSISANRNRTNDIFSNRS